MAYAMNCTMVRELPAALGGRAVQFIILRAVQFVKNRSILFTFSKMCAIIQPVCFLNDQE